MSYELHKTLRDDYRNKATIVEINDYGTSILIWTNRILNVHVLVSPLQDVDKISNTTNVYQFN